MEQSMENILVCDDDKEIVDAIEIYLSQEDFRIYKAYDGIEALDIIRKTKISLAIVDIMMPKMDGMRMVMELRKFSSIPVIFLSAKSEDSDKILGLNIGADDYVTKPFNPLELVARVKSNLRRYTTLGSMEDKENIYKTGGLVIDDNSKECFVDGERIRLTPIEYNILEFLVKNKGKVYSINQIYQSIWQDTGSFAADNTIAVHIRHIREKIEINPRDPRYLKVVWGVGYKIEDEEPC
jgi:DNA-binding response OmpR family regulator